VTWRDHLKIHPAADVFPLLPKAELEELAASIRKGGLQQKVVVYFPDFLDDRSAVLLDGRNRLDALELLGEEVIKDGRIDPKWIGMPPPRHRSPVSYVIGANIRRRHLTKKQQADLIVAATKAAATDRAKAARSVKRDEATGQVAGSTKDPVKAEVVAIAKEHGIGERTARQALVDAEPERKRPMQTMEIRGGVIKSVRNLSEIEEKIVQASARFSRATDRAGKAREAFYATIWEAHAAGMGVEQLMHWTGRDKLEIKRIISWEPKQKKEGR
jgi:hypothetical protein